LSKTKSEQLEKLCEIAIESKRECWYKWDMDWGWIAVMTLRLTRANIIRMKEALLKFVTSNPELSAAGFLILMIGTVILIAKYMKSS